MKINENKALGATKKTPKYFFLLCKEVLKDQIQNKQ